VPSEHHEHPTQAPTTLTNIGVAMFTVADQDAALAFYTDKLGFEVRGDQPFGAQGEMRWLEVAPPGSRARLALNPPMAESRWRHDRRRDA
jgi:catechol 2,3-dioxygenase-like lactoylglutathione lyase family enzyme